MNVAERNARPYDTAALDTLSKTLRSALVSDILDGMGRRDQCAAPGLRPLDPSHVAVGYAFTSRVIEVDRVPEVPYIGLLRALDSISTDEVWVVGSPSYAALWGELTSTAVRARGARGTVCDGYIRDTRMIRPLDYPVFSRGTSPRDANGRVEIVPHEGTIEVAGVRVTNGDLVVADDDGVAFVPAELTESVVTAALAKSSDESLFRVAVQQGMKPSEAFERYQVL